MSNLSTMTSRPSKTGKAGKTSRPLYHPIHNPPYQINYRSKRCGKHLSLTKRRITFQFGFSDPAAIAAGKSGHECRGPRDLELEVVCIWSHVSGKRSLYVNGREVHASKAAAGNTRFEHSWGMPGGHVLKFVGNAVPPGEQARRADPRCRQFDLLLDGRSYFDFCKIYELGQSQEGGAAAVAAEEREAEATLGYRHGYRHERGYGKALRNEEEEVTLYSSSRGSYKENDTHNYRHSSSPYEEPEQLQEEIVEDEQEVMRAPPVSEVQVAPILDFFDAPPTTATTSPLGSSSDFLDDVDQFAITASYDEFSPRNVGAVNHEKSFRDISREIMCAYHSASAAVPGNGSAVPSTHSVPPRAAPHVHNYDSHNAQPSYADSHVSNNNLSSCTDLVLANDPNPIDSITKSMQHLVNLDDIQSKPFQTLSNTTKNTPASNNHKSIQNWNLVGRAPTLSEINASMAPGSAASTVNKKEIMRTHHQHQHQQQHPHLVPPHQNYAGPHYPAQYPQQSMMMVYQQPVVMSQAQPRVQQYAGAPSGYYGAAY
ncbi:hypothetical protein ACHAXS_006927 [Conticribra weissflogii]